MKDKAAIGHWQAITSTESQVYEFHVGINYEQSEGSSEEVQVALTVGMELGIEFFGVSAQTNIEASY